MNKGFTLVELMVVVLILGALTFVVVPRINASSQEAKEEACTANRKSMDRQIEMYFVNTGSYPGSLSAVAENEDYFPDGPPVCPLEGTYSMNDDKRTVCSHGSEDEGCGG